VSHRLWTRRFGAAPAAIGGTLDIDGAPFRIVGVMRPPFSFPLETCSFWRRSARIATGWSVRTRSART